MFPPLPCLPNTFSYYIWATTSTADWNTSAAPPFLPTATVLPSYDMGEADKAYTELLGLFSHEYFHAWNVKSIKPAVFAPYNLDQENYTEQLWAFEGITSYYDDLFCPKQNHQSEAYLTLLAQSITRVQQPQGRLKQTLAQSSFSAWDKFYKQDENSPNAIVSYYQKAHWPHFASTLSSVKKRQIHPRQRNAATLSRLAQYSSRHTRKHWQSRCQEMTGLDLEAFFQTALYSTEDLPLAECLQSVGVKLDFIPLPRQHGGAFASEPQSVAPPMIWAHVLNKTATMPS